MRARLLRRSEEDHVLLFTVHHIASDGWSMGVLVREIAHLYAAYAAGRAPELPPLEVQYADFAVWQRALLSGARLDEELAHWRRCLDGAPLVLELPTDRPRPPIFRSSCGAMRAARPSTFARGRARRSPVRASSAICSTRVKATNRWSASASDCATASTSAPAYASMPATIWTAGARSSRARRCYRSNGTGEGLRASASSYRRSAPVICASPGSRRRRPS